MRFIQEQEMMIITVKPRFTGIGIRPGKSRDTVNRGTVYIDLHIKLFFGGEA